MAAECERSYDKSLEDLVAAEEDGALDAGPHGTMHSVSFRPGWEKDPAIAAWCDLSGVGPAKIFHTFPTPSWRMSGFGRAT